MKIDKNEVKQIANLVRISLTDAETDAYTKDLEKIIGYVDSLGEVDTNGIKPLVQVNGLKNVMREDKVTNLPMTEELLANAPKSENGFIKVKAVKE